MRVGRGQASVESIAIMGISLLILVTFFVLAANLLSDMNVRQGRDDARRAVQSLAAAADTAFAQGDGASQVVLINLPPNTVFGASKTFIGRPASQPNSPASTININVDGTDVYAITKAPLTGSFPGSIGGFELIVISRGSYVEIAPHIFDVNKRSVYLSMGKGASRSDTVKVYPASNETLATTAALSFSHSPAVSGSVTPASATADFEGTEFTMQFSSNNSASGIYSGELLITVLGTISGAEQNLSLPVTVFVS